MSSPLAYALRDCQEVITRPLPLHVGDRGYLARRERESALPYGRTDGRMGACAGAGGSLILFD